jgi:hypothetical protein
MEKSEKIGKIAKGLAIFQSQIGTIKKGEINPFFKSKYADLPSILEAIKEPLENSGLSYAQFPSEKGLETIVMCEDEWIQSVYPLNPTKNDPQGVGSAITYARRYSLCSIFGLSVDDDDGNAASKPIKGVLNKKEKITEEIISSENFKKFIEKSKKDKIPFQSFLGTISQKYEIEKDILEKIKSVFEN